MNQTKPIQRIHYPYVIAQIIQSSRKHSNPVCLELE
jgi:hypothetical protein